MHSTCPSLEQRCVFLPLRLPLMAVVGLHQMLWGRLLSADCCLVYYGWNGPRTLRVSQRSGERAGGWLWCLTWPCLLGERAGGREGRGGCVTTVWEEQHYKPPCPLLLPQSVTSLTLQPSITSKFLFPQNLVFQQLLNVIQYAIKWGQIPACWCSFIPAHIKRPLGGLQGWWRVILRGAPC